MKLVVFGLTVSSSWGNGHATLWRGLFRALGELGHRAIFFERDVPYYAAHRDLVEVPGCDLRLYSSWAAVLAQAQRELADADVGMVTSYCPDGIAASQLVLSTPAVLHAFYDLDTPVTLHKLRSGQRVDYIPDRGLGDFDLVLSYTGGIALDLLRSELGARHVEPLYGSVDPVVHRPVEPRYEYDLSYLGTYSSDRQSGLDSLFLEPARKMRRRRFLIGGAQYPGDFPWSENIWYIPHVPPPHHPPFYCSSSLTLNVTRAAMAQMGFCPSGRLFEAAACAVPVLSDSWQGLGAFFEPGREILVAESTAEAVDAIGADPKELAQMGRAARARVLSQHTAQHRARELVGILNAPVGGVRVAARASS